MKRNAKLDHIVGEVENETKKKYANFGQKGKSTT